MIQVCKMNTLFTLFLHLDVATFCFGKLWTYVLVSLCWEKINWVVYGTILVDWRSLLCYLFVYSAKGKLLLPPQCKDSCSAPENFPVHCFTESKYPQTDAMQTYYLKFPWRSLYLKDSNQVCEYWRNNSVRKYSAETKAKLRVALWPILFSLQQFKV